MTGDEMLQAEAMLVERALDRPALRIQGDGFIAVNQGDWQSVLWLLEEARWRADRLRDSALGYHRIGPDPVYDPHPWEDDFDSVEEDRRDFERRMP